MSTNKIAYIILVGVIIVLATMVFVTPTPQSNNNDKIELYKDTLHMQQNTIDSYDTLLDSVNTNYLYLAMRYDSVIKQKKYLEDEYKSKDDEIHNASVTDDELWLDGQFPKRR
jgi:hypothetical protein